MTMKSLVQQNESVSRPGPQWLFRSIDLIVTLLLWSYFTLGFILLFAPLYAIAFALAPNRHLCFQRLNHYFYRGFFRLCRMTIPLHKWRIQTAVKRVQSSVIVCNHISYIDPILLISLFGCHTTIVKDRLFKIPIFGWMLKQSGYLPSASDGRLAELMIERMATLGDDLKAGANLIVFPEGTRSRTGSIGTFNTGAFKIAKICRAPVAVLFIRNTDRLFTPGKFLFDTRRANTITVELLAQLRPPYDQDHFSVAALMDQVHDLMEKQMASVDS